MLRVINEIAAINKLWTSLVQKNKLSKRLHPVGFEPTRIGDTVGLKSTSLDHSDKDAYTSGVESFLIYF